MRVVKREIYRKKTKREESMVLIDRIEQTHAQKAHKID